MRDGTESGAPVSVAAEAAARSEIRTIPMLDLSRQYSQIGPELLAAAEQVLAAQNFILGKQVSQFEAAAAEACRVAHAVGCSSGTDALWLCFAAAGIGAGDSVITTPFSFISSVSAVLRAGARPILADIDPRTFNLSPEAVERLLGGGSPESRSNSSTKAILPVHLYGQTADWDRFLELKQKYGVLLIEDAAQAFGAAWHGAPAGSLGDLAAFSFYPTKNLGGSGDAGMVTTPDQHLAERLRMLRAHGMRRRYYHDELGWNCRLDTMQAALLLVKLKHIAAWNERRRAVAANYDRLFAQAGLVEKSSLYPVHGVVLPWTDPRATHVFHQYVVRTGRRNGLLASLEARRIGAEVYYPVPLHLQTSLQHLGYERGDFPESERASEEVLALPIYPELRLDEQEAVVSTIADFLS